MLLLSLRFWPLLFFFFPNNLLKAFLVLIYFIDYAITVVSFAPLNSPPPCTTPPTHIPPPFSSCPWVIHISFLTSTFPILFLTSPCLFSTYHLCYLFSVPFSPLSCPSLSPADNPPCDLHFCDSAPVLVVCLVCFCFCYFFSLVNIVSLLSFCSS